MFNPSVPNEHVYWMRNTQSTPTIVPPERVGVSIVGAGISGVSVAYWLRESGYTDTIALIDGRGVASGATGRSKKTMLCVCLLLLSNWFVL
jgi:ribulose 1,5-bisphosphate synthetase/thiazole synthase